MSGMPVRIVIVGFGVVGTGVVRMLTRNRESVCTRCGGDFEIVAIAEKDPARRPAPEFGLIPVVRDVAPLLSDPSVDIVVELIGGTGAARQVVLNALENGKHVVTANKALLSQHWQEIFAVARRRGCGVRFESSVMAGVPVIRGLNDGLAGNAIRSLVGILNGTSNFILSQMDAAGMTFDKALAAAHKRGLCEADATLDVDGRDAAHKLSILASLAMGRWLPPTAIHTEGIADIDRRDVAYASEEFNYRLKLLAVFRNHGAAVEARVHPAFVSGNHPLASVGDAFNALFVEADAAGPLMFYGLGAGEQPAASGVVSDIITLARSVTAGVRGPSLIPAAIAGEPAVVVPMADVESKFYLRLDCLDKPGVLSRIAGALGKRGVSISACFQRGRAVKGAVPVILVTHEAREGAMRAALEELATADFLHSRPSLIRIGEP